MYNHNSSERPYHNNYSINLSKTMTADLHKLPAITQVPWLMGATDDPELSEDEQQIICTLTLHHEDYYWKEIAELVGHSILASSQGWLILRDRVNKGKFYVWNPVTRKFIHLPEIVDTPDEERPPISILTSSPDDCHASTMCLLLVFFTGLVFSCVPVTTRGECVWVKQGYDCIDESVRIVSISEAACLKGCIYAYATHVKVHDHRVDAVVRMKVVTNGSSYAILFEKLDIKIPRSNMAFSSYYIPVDYLVEVSGDLYGVNITPRQLDEIDDYDISKAVVWRLDASQLEWIPVDSLGDRALLLGDNCCTWCWAGAEGIEGNCLYVARPGHQTMHQYRLQDDSYTLLSTPDLAWPFDGPYWFMPHNPTRPESVDKLTSEKEQIDQETETMEMSKTTTLPLLLQLPSDMKLSIGECLHLFDYMSLQATCRTLESNIPRPRWRCNFQYPLFMSPVNNKGLSELRDPCLNTSHTIRTPRALAIAYCNNGWSLLRTDDHSLQGLNPFTGEKSDYPVDPTICCSIFAFSTSPTSPDCVTVGIESVFRHVEIYCF